jgi:hypothetical protein
MIYPKRPAPTKYQRAYLEGNMAPPRSYFVGKEAAEKLERAVKTCPPYIRPARYFILRCNEENLEVSYRERVWATTYGPTQKLKDAFNNTKNVMLIFSVTNSGCF